MESSLAAMCKKFGHFSQSLTAIYMTQVLEGLKYLHVQGVLHRDIKGANILTTKNGLVKLADFGVAMKLSDKMDEDIEDVVGTPYWMAPEIIEMTGTTTACDLWSVGCTIIELLTGKPPYFDLPQMTALYKIVQDDHPPLPDGVSQALKDFLLQCFKKEPQMRKSAVELMNHAWLKNPRNHLNKRVWFAGEKGGWGGGADNGPGPTGGTGANMVLAGSTAVAKVAAAVAAAAGIKTPGKMGVGGQGGGGNPVVVTEDVDDMDWDQELGLSAPPAINELGKVAKDQVKGKAGRVLPGIKSIAAGSEEAQQHMRAIKGAAEKPSGSGVGLNLKLTSLDANALDDWGDDDLDDSSAGAGAGVGADAGGQGKAQDSKGAKADEGESRREGPSPLFEGKGGQGVIGMEATALRRYMEEDDKDDPHAFDDMELPPEAPRGGGALLSLFKRPGSLADNLKAKMSQQQNRQGALSPLPCLPQGRLMPPDMLDRDVEDPFGDGFEELDLGLEEEADSGEKAVGQDVFTKLSRLEMEDAGAGDLIETGIQVGVLSKRRSSLRAYSRRSSKLCGTVATAKLICWPALRDEPSVTWELFHPPCHTPDDLLAQVCGMLEACPEARLYVMSADRGVAPLMYLIQTIDLSDERGEEALAHVMAVINKIVEGNLKALESLVMVGIVPKVIAIAAHSASNSSDLTLQTLISCGGLSTLVHFLSASPRTDLIPDKERGGWGGAGEGKGVEGDTFTRFLKHAMDTSSSSTAAAAARAGIGVGAGGDRAEEGNGEGEPVIEGGAASAPGGVGRGVSTESLWPYVDRAAQILTNFSKSDRVVKEGLAEQQCLGGIIGALSSLFPLYVSEPQFAQLAVTLLIVLKNVSMEPSTLEALDSAGAITALVPLLERQDGPCHEDMENQVLQCLFYLCLISRKRQERAAVAGLIPYLHRCIREESRLKQFALQMVCDLAHSSSVTRDLLWREGGLEFYLSIISNPKDNHWHVATFRSISACLLSDNDMDRVAKLLVLPTNLDKTIFLFCTARQAEFEKVVEELHRMMDKSLLLVKALGSSATFIEEIKSRLHYPKAIVGKTLLTMLRAIHRHHPNPRALTRNFDLYPSVRALARNESQVLVAEIATQLLQEFDDHGKYGI
ncbi:unnamed protein product [Discosporangium mesarthrocarpum]